jgi:transcriptional regulator with XRE-family HTH domain
MGVQDSQKWRQLLGKIIKDTHEKQRIATELGVSVITLSRWASGESTPRLPNFRALIKALPEHRAALAEALPDEILRSLNEPADIEDTEYEIPSVFYARVLNAHCNLPQILHFSSICDIILQQALKQLDPNRLGMEATIVRCMSPSRNKKIRSLRESLGRGTPPWHRELEQRTLFLGAESLAGYVVSSGRPLPVNHGDPQNLFPAHWIEHEESAMAYPIMMSDQVAGCLLLSSTEPNYFQSPARQRLVQYYAELLLMAFEPEDFYNLQDIELGHIPSQEVQRSYLASFRQRVAEVMILNRVDVIRAEQIVWQQIEDDLLQYPLMQETK